MARAVVHCTWCAAKALRRRVTDAPASRSANCTAMQLDAISQRPLGVSSPGTGGRHEGLPLIRRPAKALTKSPARMRMKPASTIRHRAGIRSSRSTSAAPERFVDSRNLMADSERRQRSASRDVRHSPGARPELLPTSECPHHHRSQQRRQRPCCAPPEIRKRQCAAGGIGTRAHCNFQSSAP